MSQSIPVTSKEYIRVPIAWSDGDPTGFPVELAITDTDALPVEGDWKVAAWETVGSQYLARIVVGPGSLVVLAEGTYLVWARVTTAAEKPVLSGGTLTVYDTPFAPTPLVGLCSVADLGVFLQRDLDEDDSAANLAIELATGSIRAEARQTLTFVEDDEVVLHGNWTADLWLPERPVIDVTEVTIQNGAIDSVWSVSSEVLAETAYTWDRKGLLRRTGGGWWGGDRATVLVTYSHGYTSIPGPIKGLCLQVAAQVYESTGSLLTMDPVDGVEGFRDATTRGNADLLTKAARRLLRNYRPVLR